MTRKLNQEKKKVRGKGEGATCMREVEGGVRKTGVHIHRIGTYLF